VNSGEEIGGGEALRGCNGAEQGGEICPKEKKVVPVVFGKVYSTSSFTFC
jgi:hypothetical protein